MKRAISGLLVVCLLASYLLSATGCSLFAKKIDSGTEAAKLLLANERLDENVVGGKIDLGFSDVSVSDTDSTLNRLSSRSVKRLSGSSATKLSTTAKSTGYTWTDFPNYSPSYVEFTQFVESIEHTVAGAAKEITYMKNNVGITDKWVQLGYEKRMLRVYEDRDVLITVDEYGVSICYRYTDENAKNVYEIYSLMSYNDGTTGEIRTMLIPGERYEYMYNNSNGFTDYFIGENSRGYWLNTRFNYHKDGSHRSASFDPYIAKDGLGYGAFLQIDSYANQLQNPWYYVFDPANQRELFRVHENESRYQFDLYIPGIQSGFVSVSTDKPEYNGVVGKYETNLLDTLTTTKGSYAAADQAQDNSFAFTGGHTQYLAGDDFFSGAVEFTIENPEVSLPAAAEKLETYLGSIGLKLHCDMEDVATSLEHAQLLSENFGESFYWNGYKMNSIENIEKARAVLQKQFDDARAAYEAVKNFETADSRQKLSDSAHFAKLDAAAAGNNSFSDTTVKLSGVAVSTNDVALFENGKEYVLKVGISLLDDNGNPISVNTVPLSGTAPAAVSFGGNSIRLTASGEYEIPLNLHQGKYAVVVYIATKDEGIRVSEIQKVAFVSIQKGEIASSAMYLEAGESNKNLILAYHIKNIRRITVTATKENYTYKEIERLVNLEILAYGAPFHGAVLEYENGAAVDADATLGKGTYRMMCYLATDDGLAQSYVYLTVK